MNELKGKGIFKACLMTDLDGCYQILGDKNNETAKVCSSVEEKIVGCCGFFWSIFRLIFLSFSFFLDSFSLSEHACLKIYLMISPSDPRLTSHTKVHFKHTCTLDTSSPQAFYLMTLQSQG